MWRSYRAREACFCARARENYNDMIINSATYRHWYTQTHSHTHTLTHTEGVNEARALMMTTSTTTTTTTATKTTTAMMMMMLLLLLLLLLLMWVIATEWRARLNVCLYSSIITTCNMYIFILYNIYTLSTFAFQLKTLKHTHTNTHTHTPHAINLLIKILYYTSKQRETHKYTTHSRPSTVLCFYFFFASFFCTVAAAVVVVVHTHFCFAVDCFQHTHTHA